MNRREFVAAVAGAAVTHGSKPTQDKPTSLGASTGGLTFVPATELAERIRSRTVSAVEVLDAHLARIAQYNPKLNAIVTLDADRARERAKQADDALARGEVWGPFHGLPVTFEDAHATSGIRSTWGGFPDLATHVPSEDATVVARLKSAGAIVIGKTNGPQIWPNSVFERTNNPWNVEHTPGGSSAGPAAAVAAGLTPLDVGLDTFGSITNPSHYCGIYGMRPTEHRVPLTGSLFIDSTRKWRRMSVAGPMARSLTDLKQTLRLLSGPDGFDTEVPAVPWREVAELGPKALRVAWTPSFGGMPVASDIRDGVANAVQSLTRIGAETEEVLPAIDFEAHTAVGGRLFELIAGSDTPDAGTLRDYFAVLEERDHYISEWNRFLTDWDVFLCPPGATTAERHDSEETVVDGSVIPPDELQSLDIPYALSPVSGCPAVVMPMGTDRHGLPMGIQLMCRRWEDERLLAIAKLVSDVTGGFRPPPGY